MRILFWNTGNRPVVDLLGDLGRLRNPDVIVLAETADPIRNVVSRLNKDARQVYSSAHDPPASVRRPLHVLTRLPKGRIEALRDDAGVAVKRVRPIIGPDFTMAAVHLGSKLFRTQEDQAFAAASINRDIEGIEHRVGHRRTMVIGDFNMSPFELGLVSSVTGYSGRFRPCHRGEMERTFGKLRHDAVAPAQFCRSGGTGFLPVWRGGARCSGRAFSPGRRRGVLVGAAAKSGCGVGPGGCGRPGVEMAESEPGGAVPRVSVRGRGPRGPGRRGCAGPGGADARSRAAGVRRAAAGRGLRGRRVRGRAASW